MFLLPARILFSWAIISCVSSSNVSTLAATLFIVSSESSPICSFLSLVLTMSLSLCLILFHILNTFIHYLTSCFYHPPNIFKPQIRELPIFPNSSYLVTQLLLGDFKGSRFFPFPHHSLPVSSNRFTVIIKRLNSKETFHSNLIHVLRPLCSDSSMITTGFPLSNQGTPAGRRTFPYRSSPIYAVTFRILIWHFSGKRSSEF